MRGKLTDFRIGQRLEIRARKLTIDGIANPRVHAIALVAGIAADEQLRDQQILPAFADLEVNMRRGPAVVFDRLDRSESVLPIRSGGELAVTLKIAIRLIAGAL